MFLVPHACDEVKKRFKVSKAYHAQRIIAENAVLRDDYETIRVVVGLDVSYVKTGEFTLGIGVAVALSYPSFRIVDCSAVYRVICIPYIPGLLAFREMAVLAPALKKLLARSKVDLLVVDGHGIAHPRKAGIATHVGVVFNLPSIGVAKKRLFGEERNIQGKTYLLDREGHRIAVVIPTRSSRIYASPGHRVSVETSGRLVDSMLKNYKLPMPTYVADKITKQLRREAPSLKITPDLSPHPLKCSTTV